MSKNIKNILIEAKPLQKTLQKVDQQFFTLDVCTSVGQGKWGGGHFELLVCYTLPIPSL